MQTPDEWLADFEAKVAELQQKATEFKQDLEAAGATEQSPAGDITVTVAPNGSLTALRLTDAAMSRTADELAAEIMVTTRRARQAAATQVAEAFVPVGGDRDTVQHIPTPDEDELAAEKPQPTAPSDEDDNFATRSVYRNTDPSW